MDDDSGGEDGEPAADGFVFSADDPVGEGLADDEAQKIAAGLTDDGEPARFTLSKDSDADGAGEEVEEHAHCAELWA